MQSEDEDGGKPLASVLRRVLHLYDGLSGWVAVG